MNDEPAQRTGHSVDLSAHTEPRRFVTQDVAPVGGRIKVRAEDFIVEEIPATEPSGEGEHLALYVEKRNMATLELVSALASHFGVRHRAIGYAGLKDKRAVTRQMLTVHLPGREDTGAEFAHDRATVLWAARHKRKLRRGHHAGNRFLIRIRGVDPSAVVRAKAVLDELARSGVPNRFGPQRFGVMDNNHLIGRALVLRQYERAVELLLSPGDRVAEGVHRAARERFAAGDYAGALELWPASLRAERTVLRRLIAGANAAEALRTIQRTEWSYYLSAFQSAVFNAVLDRRIDAGTMDRLLEGDVAIKGEGRGVFAVTGDVLADPETGRRMASIEISPTGPMWGPGMMRAGGEVDGVEVACLEATGVGIGDLDSLNGRSGAGLEGARRPLRVALANPRVEAGADEHGPYVQCVFELPRGSFATVVMQEVIKPAGSAPAL